jgi:hypothetical protein
MPLRSLVSRRLLGIGSLFTFALVASSSTAQQYTDIRRLGTSNAISKPGPKNGDELKRIFQRNRADYEKVLRDANWPGNPEDLFRAVESGSFTEAKYPVGHTFEWMAVKKRGVAQPTGPIRWAGSDPFEAFEIRFESNGKAHRFLIPKACGNLALVAMGPTEAQIQQEREQQRVRALTPSLRVQAPNSCTQVNVTVDVTVPGGMPEGGSLQLTLTRPSGQRETLTAEQAGGGYRWQGKLNDAGSYTFTAVIDSPLGRSQEATERLNLEPCQPTCNLQLTPPPVDPTPKAGKASIGVDMCASAARVGQISSRSVKIFHTPIDGPEQLVNTLALDTECKSSYLMPEYGAYRFEGTVTDDRGMSATCQADYTLVKPEKKIDPFFTLFGGKERRVREFEHDDGTVYADGQCAPLFGGTVGLAFPIADGGAQVFGQGGVVINTDDSGNSSLLADVGIDKNFEGGYFGGGIGVWDFNHGDTVDGSIFLHGGFDINDKLQWNFEGRLFMSALDDIQNNYALFTGIRYFWKR